MAEDSAAETKRRPRKVLWLVIGLIVLSLGAAAAAAYFLLIPPETAGVESKEEAAPIKQAPIFVDISPFTVNITSTNGVSHLLYIGMSFSVGSAETRDLLEERMPQVRSRILILLSGQKADELTSAEGKEQLASELVAALKQPPLADYQPELALEEVLFTEFIVQ